MANQIGQALEDISRATGSVAHLYKSLNLGSSGSEARVSIGSNNEVFGPLIRECGVVQQVNMPRSSGVASASAPSQPQPAAA